MLNNRRESAIGFCFEPDHVTARRPLTTDRPGQIKVTKASSTKPVAIAVVVAAMVIAAALVGGAKLRPASEVTGVSATASAEPEMEVVRRELEAIRLGIASAATVQQINNQAAVIQQATSQITALATQVSAVTNTVSAEHQRIAAFRTMLADLQAYAKKVESSISIMDMHLSTAQPANGPERTPPLIPR